MGTGKMNFFQKFAASFTRFKAYAVFAKESSSKAMAYLVLLTLTVGTIGMLKPLIDYNNGVNEILDSFSAEVRDFTFENGRLEVEGDMPIVIEENSTIFIIDTTGATTADALNEYSQGMLLTDTQLIQKQSGMQTRTTDFSALSGVTLTKASVEKLLPLLKIFGFFIVLFGWIGFFISKLFSALVVALLALILGLILGVKVPFGSLYKISIYALTAPVIIETIIKFIGLSMPFYFWLFHFAALAFVFFGLKEIKREQEEAQTLPPENPENLLPGDNGSNI